MNDEYIKKFVLSIGFFMEDILTINELVKNFQHLIFLINYFNFVKDNQMLSYSLLLTVINKHSKTLTVIEWYELYNILLSFKKYILIKNLLKYIILKYLKQFMMILLKDLNLIRIFINIQKYLLS